jgi:TusA-related sulfurtransferase
MRIDGPSPILPAGSAPAVRDVRPVSAPEATAPLVKDHVEMQPKPEVNLTNVVVEMQPGNIVVYKFVDEASGRLIQQIPSEQMLSLSEIAQSNDKPAKQK